ncbi:MAG: CBS domain-containing protein, partial [Actinomycetes bacterium]
MLVNEDELVAGAMTREVVLVGPGHTLREVAAVMAKRNVGAAVVLDGESSGIGIITERDILRSIAAGENPDIETAHDHQTTDVVYATPSWSLGEAANAMMRGGFRHLIVLDGSEA